MGHASGNRELVRDSPAPCEALVTATPVLVRGAAGGDPLGFPDRAGRGAVAERATAQLFPVVPGQPAGQVRAVRDDAGRVEVLVDQVVVLLGLQEVDRVAEARGLEQ